ncbi:hypothetical protein OS493_018834 [Desmophyllum pertusum]|uniref:VWFA domain-containing protein n=1 Tax=Desmophyllum pertusum TaxID=174260 RepID=A0A9W9ZDJ3_9CNID|nr:hypothetical protein OS493_018834 [Desmophyllum pertusum]
MDEAQQGNPLIQTNPNDPYYQAFQNVPSANATAKKFMTNFLRIPYWTISPAQRWLTERRDFEIEFNVVVMDGSGSVAVCEFEKGKKALKYMMDEMHNPNLVDANYAAVTFSTSAKVNFRFLQYSTAASEILNIPYPGDSTNTQAGLAEAKKLFDYVPFSGGRLIYTRTVLLVTDGQSKRPDPLDHTQCPSTEE